MKKTILFVLCTALCVSSQSQNNMQSIFLEKYTIPLDTENARIGAVKTLDENCTITLDKDTAGIFKISEEGVLYLKEGKKITDSSPFGYEITIGCSDKKQSFELVADNFTKNKVIAHRGAWKHNNVHQNSLGSLKKAIEIGCEGSEFDVWLTKDNQVVLNHDHAINGLVVEETDLAELQKIVFDRGETMPILEQYINCIKQQNKTRLVLEIKSNKENTRAITLADSVVSIVNRMEAQAWVDYISFDYRALQRVKELDPSATISYLEADRPLDLQKVEGMDGIDYHHSHYDKIERLHDRAKALGLTTNTWTVNDEALMKRFLDMDVDYITTDEPELLLQLINNKSN